MDASLEPSTGHPVCHYRATVNRTALHAQTPLRSAPRQLRGPFTRWPRAADTVLAIALFVATVFVTSEGPNNDDLVIRSAGDIPIAAFFVLAVASGVLYWRRSQPLVVLGATLVALALSIGLGYSELVGITMLVALYSVGRYVVNDRWSYMGLGGTWAVHGFTAFIDAATAAEIGFGVFVMFLVWYIGRRIRIRGERASQLQREQAAEARREVVEERTRIARELHDIVAHRVSLMTVQAGAAKTVAADDPEGALHAMEAVEQAGRQALGELRHLLGVLRPEAEVNGLGPQPGLADLPRLVDQFEEAGLVVSLTMDGVQTDLPARVDLFAYRIVQEALTNVLKHAGPSARIEVRLGIDNQRIAIEVLDNGHGATILPGSGHGIVGMRERALLLGGSLDAGPRPGGGFQVVAQLPIGEEPA
jgi:signal transduction histidine kinase